ncbi:hypothetical protein B0H13DRAFT_1920400 [Mycena leptocephala]|nr:hypothetical protein B0H13DRAFT_1920400 [Mycena leptocephala]
MHFLGSSFVSCSLATVWTVTKVYLATRTQQLQVFQVSSLKTVLQMLTAGLVHACASRTSPVSTLSGGRPCGAAFKGAGEGGDGEREGVGGEAEGEAGHAKAKNALTRLVGRDARALGRHGG